MRHQQVGVAIVGAGRIGALRARIAATHPAVKFLAISDQEADRASALAHQVEADFASGNNLDVISRTEVDAVIVSTSEPEHMQPVMQALECGKSVLVEKPVALSLADLLWTTKALMS